AMQAGQERLGMQTANQSLATLYMKRLITMETAMAASSLREELQDMLQRGVGVVAGAGLGRGPGPAVKWFGAERRRPGGPPGGSAGDIPASETRRCRLLQTPAARAPASPSTANAPLTAWTQ